MPAPKPWLQVEDIRRWAKNYHDRTGNWPNYKSGQVAAGVDETWWGIETALSKGKRGMEGGSSLVRFLEHHCGRRNKKHLPHISETQILRWADSHRRRTGEWPDRKSGAIPEDPNETWEKVSSALKAGLRGLPGGSSIPRLLEAKRGRRNIKQLPPLTIKQLLEWADRHYRRAGKWPSPFSGRVIGAKDETWGNLNSALVFGRRGLPSGTTLERFLAKHRNRPYQKKGRPLNQRQIVAWARLHHLRTGMWPNKHSGDIPGTDRESWDKIENAMVRSLRGFTNRTTLRRFLAERVGLFDLRYAPPLTIAQILSWADAYFAKHRRWPSATSGVIPENPHQKWLAIDVSLRFGRRGLAGNTSLAELLENHRGRRHLHRRPRFTIEKILYWADAYHDRTGKWPTVCTRKVDESCNDTWRTVESALKAGNRGLKGGSSLHQILVKHRGKYDQLNPPKLTVEMILKWADAYYERTGDWPSRSKVRVAEQPGDTWSKIEYALRQGRRGLRRGSTLVKLLTRHRGELYRRRGQPLKRSEILQWATEHHELTGRLPTTDSGPVRGQPGETWRAIDAALRSGSRTLRGRTSLGELLEHHYVPAYPAIGRKLSERTILRWANSFKKRVGYWPTKASAFTDSSRTEKWSVVDTALREGLRGLPGRSSLAKLCAQRATTRS